MRMLLVYRCIVIGISNRCIDVLFTSMRGVVNIIIFKKILVWCQRTWCYEWEEDGGGGKTRENNRAVHVTEIAYRAYRARTLIRLKWLFQHTTLVDSRPTWASYARCQLLHWPLQETNPIWTKYKGHWRDDVQEQGWTLKQKIQMCHSYGIPLYPIQSKTNEQTSKHTKTMSSLSQHPFEANSGLGLFTLRGTPHTPAPWVVIRIHKHAEFLNLPKLTARRCRWNSQQSLTIAVGVLLTTAPVHHTFIACIPRSSIPTYRG